MDHKEAVQLQAAVKYVLGELPQAERDSFEEHYFDCGECALDVKAAAAFVDVGREVLRAERFADVAGRSVENRGGWLGWLRPVIAVPALAVLMLLLGYQSLVSIPHWRSLATQATTSRVLPMYSLISANSRGSDSLTFKVRPGERFGLYVDVPNDENHGTYLIRLVDPAGRSTILRSLSYAEVQKTQVVEVDSGEQTGTYQIVVLGLSGPETDPAKGTTFATMKFEVEVDK